MNEEQIDYRWLLSLGWKYWYVFVILLPLVMAGAYFYLKIQAPVYESNALLLIKDDESSGQLSETKLLEDLGMTGNKQNMENEKYILSSTPVMHEVVKKMDLQYQYFQFLPFQRREMYLNSPIQIANWQPVKEEASFYGELEIDKEGGYQITFMNEEEEELVYNGEFGKALSLPKGKLTLTFNEMEGVEGPFAIRITAPWKRAKELLGKLEVSETGEESSIFSIKYKDVSPIRARDVLAEMIEQYNQRSIDLENQVFRNTINLINERIELIAEELSEAERSVEDYKQQFGMTQLSAEGSLILSEMSQYNNKVKESEVQLAILESVKDYLVKNQEDFEFVPTNITISNPTLLSQLESFNRLIAEKQEKEARLGPAHPDLKLVDRQIQNLRRTIVDNIESMRNDLVIARDANQELKDDLEGRLRSLPRRERELIEIERRKNVKENLYLYLLEKREESAISMAITRAKGEIVEPAVQSGSPVSPKPMLVWLNAGILGMGLPVGLIALIVFMNNKIQTEEEVERLTSLPIAGVLAQGPKKKELVVRQNSRTVVAEMFRMLRANLAYITPGKKLQTLLITSVTSGEGKSFISLNLGAVQAMSGKKVVLLEFDLRKPREVVSTSENGEEVAKGIVNFLVDPAVEIEEIINSSGFDDNLDVIHCGPRPLNPSELILSERLPIMMEKLRERYDFIILDSPPVGIVADALQLRDVADASLFVVRAGYTPKNFLKVINNIAENDKLPRPFIVLNGMQMDKFGYGYTTSSGYLYASNYIKSNGYFEKEA